MEVWGCAQRALAPPRHPGSVVVLWLPLQNILGLDCVLNPALVGRQLVLHLLQNRLRASSLSADVPCLLWVTLNVEQRELLVMPVRLRFVGHTGWGIVPSV